MGIDEHRTARGNLTEIFAKDTKKQERELRTQVKQAKFLEGVLVTTPNVVKYVFSEDLDINVCHVATHNQFEKSTIDGNELWYVYKVQPKGIEMKSNEYVDQRDWEGHVSFAEMIANGTIIDHDFHEPTA